MLNSTPPVKLRGCANEGVERLKTQQQGYYKDFFIFTDSRFFALGHLGIRLIQFALSHSCPEGLRLAWSPPQMPSRRWRDEIPKEVE